MNASWVIREKSTGTVIMETLDRKKVAALNTAKYEAVPIGEYLAALNARVPSEQRCDPICFDGRTKMAECPNAACRWSGRCNIAIGEEGRHR